MCPRPVPVPAGAAGGAAAGMAGAALEQMGSPGASMHGVGAHPQESRGTARGTILAGAAHSILTTAAAGEGETVDEGGKALSPLVAAKAYLLQAHATAAHAAGPAGAAAATPGSGSVGGTPGGPLPVGGAAPASSEQAAPPVQSPTMVAALQAVYAAAPGSGQPNGVAHSGPSPAAEGGPSPPLHPLPSTLAVDLAPAQPNGSPQPSASFQPSSLPPPGVVAAALVALEAAQAAAHGGPYATPPPAAVEQLGELYATLHQNGYATHANSAIGNGHMAQSSPDRELTSPSRLLTHDSTGSGSRSRQAAKRRRTSGGPVGSTQRT